jgi:hypothetical protein
MRRSLLHRKPKHTESRFHIFIAITLIFSNDTVVALKSKIRQPINPFDVPKLPYAEPFQNSKDDEHEAGPCSREGI